MQKLGGAACGLAALLLVCAALPAAAEDRQTGGPTILDEASPDAVLAALERGGFEAEIGKDDEGDPKINSTDKSQPFGVHFYGCDDDHAHCKYVQLTQGWNLKKGITLDKIDAWNNDNVWGQAYRDDEKDPWLALTINFEGGVTPEYVDNMLDWWSIIVDDYEKAIGWDKD
ncbi:MAG: YbjN domain-containing protein [Bauldia sp.]